MIAFPKFNDIENLNSLQEKHKAWLEDYKGEGLIYSIAEKGKHKIKWATEKRKYKEWFPEINCIARLPNRTIIEFDDEDEKIAKENLEKVYSKLKELNFGFIRSTHKGKTDYLWVEFTRDMEDKEIKNFLKWICPEEATIDINFASSKRVFPVMYATHWKHSYQREMPIEYFEGEQINYDSLEIVEDKSPIIIEKKGDYLYHTFIKASNIFTKKGQVEEFEKLQPLFYDKSGMFWLWNNKEKKWEISDEIDILNMIADTTNQDTIGSKNRTEILNALKQMGRLKIPKPIKNTWIQFKDLIYDLKTGEKFEATPEYFVTNPIPHKISGDPQTPNMDKIFEEWVGKKYVRTLKEILAYCMLPDYPIHRIFCLVGSGLNGKGSFLNVIETFIGKENICSTELDTLLSSRFEVTRLFKKLVCVMGETNFSELSRTSMLKKLSGGDMIGFEYKNKNPFEEKNYAKIIIATNNLPTTTDKTIGFYRRWFLIDFPNQFDEKKDILKDIPIKEYENLATECFIILSTIIKKREFTNEGTIEERKERYEAKSNFLERFIELFILEDFNGFITKADFNKKFKSWCKENRHREMSETSVGLKMKEKGYESSTKHFDWLFDGKGGNARIWLGMKWEE